MNGQHILNINWYYWAQRALLCSHPRLKKTVGLGLNGGNSNVTVTSNARKHRSGMEIKFIGEHIDELCKSNGKRRNIHQNIRGLIKALSSLILKPWKRKDPNIKWLCHVGNASKTFLL